MLASLGIVCILAFVSSCKKDSQVPESTLSATQLHRLSGDEEVKDAIILKNGNSILVGGKLDDGFIVMLNPDNEIVWEREIAKSGTDAFFTVTEMPNGDILAAGHTNSREYSTDRLSTDILLVKYNANGDILMDIAFGTEYDDKPNDILVDLNGDILIVGSVNNHIQRTYGYKLRSDGKLIWKKQYQFGPYFNEAKAICDLGNGSYLIGGVQSKSNKLIEIRTMHTFTCSIDANGDILSYTPYETYLRSYLMFSLWAPMDLIKTPNGFLLSTFFYDESETEGLCVQFLELGADYSITQQKRLFGIGSFKPFKIFPQSEGYLITGSSSKDLSIDAYGFRTAQACVFKLDNNLNITWNSMIGSEGLVQEAYTAVVNKEHISVHASSINLFTQSANILTYFVHAKNGELVYEKD